MRIGMFDSGVGGLTVLNSFLKYHPNNEYIYYGDTLNVPYGNKSKEELFKLSKNIIEFLESKNVDIIIIACGTVSSNVYEELKKITNIPIYSIISELPEYIKNNNHKNVLALATSATINTHVFKNKLDANVIEVACPKLVPLIEENNSEKLDEVINEYLTDTDKIDSIILGCTHYPLIKDKIEKKINKNIDIIELGEILAKKIAINDSFKNVKLCFTKETESLNENIKRILNFNKNDLN